ncbi:ROK family transcriptional regulator [Alkalihalobacillus pseudalcaliphilus]|uniref:ROK family transcriptional regulator n=1 Tax=Alkalihalobacillus pseudalcaliphilus TaxID=79884 RepID=UPI00064DC493|nr:ROK family protein [Alkalihalobacillus pseudalcaliphilus]KMK75158.1 hypothetical protein AB990_17085 [Alkalihalobacillus pseudalcaliphilus]
MLKHDQLYIKHQNKHWVYEIIKTKEPITKPDIVKITKMSATSINRIVNELISEDLIYERENATKTVGRNAVFLQINRLARYSIGIEYDMKIIRIGMINLKGELEHLKEHPYQVRENSAGALNVTIQLIESILIENNIDKKRVLGIGVGLPGYIDEKNGRVVHSDQLLWDHIEMTKFLYEKTGLPTVVDNELKMQVMAEKNVEQMDDGDTMILVGIGSGIGSSVFINGDIYRGSSNKAGEIGHSIVNPNGHICKCGKVGCLASYISERSLIQQAKMGMDVATVEDLVIRYEEKHPLARSIMNQAITYLAIGIGNIFTTYDPKIVVIAGHFFEYFPKLKLEFELKLSQYCHQEENQILKYSTLKQKGVVLGAGIVAGEHFLQLEQFS